MEAHAARADSERPGGARLSARVLGLASDARLVRLVRDGSQPAFEVVFDRHHRAILSFCRHMLGDATEAEDAVQHTFMAAWRDLLGSEKDILLKPWLFTIARNRCLSILRARRERPMEEFDTPSMENLAADVEVRADLQDLLRDMAELPEDQRAALVLSELGDVSHDDIAAVLGCRREKVKALVFQARSSLAASRNARDTDCQVIREQLANLSGGALRRTALRRHLAGCAGCREFADQVSHQRKAMALVLPVAPTLLLKQNALAAAFGQSGLHAAGAAAGGAVAGGAVASGASGGAAVAGASSTGAGALAAKVLVVLAVAGGGTAAAVKSSSHHQHPVKPPAPPSKQAAIAPATTPETSQGVTQPASANGTPVKRRTRPHGSHAGGRHKSHGHHHATSHHAGAKAKGHAKAIARRGKAVGHAKSGAATAHAKSQARAKARAKARRHARAKTRHTPSHRAHPKATPTPAATPKAHPRPHATPKPKPVPTVTATPSVIPTIPAADPGKGDSRKSG